MGRLIVLALVCAGSALAADVLTWDEVEKHATSPAGISVGAVIAVYYCYKMLFPSQAG